MSDETRAVPKPGPPPGYVPVPRTPPPVRPPLERSVTVRLTGVTADIRELVDLMRAAGLDVDWNGHTSTRDERTSRASMHVRWTR
ncbi:hypothetical protein BJY24_007828 [Nocardia transvalensis]|uniref:Uncharacterized protein n=1 Tax=Nocardia transvalensis TaxID=37333 RepID=A0A7W9UMS1_9NOCA|nr:hypothetical protein [Nocardia transvalensis]MBB5918916.1 hypothetical protein [Nocardia transvalensis]